MEPQWMISICGWAIGRPDRRVVVHIEKEFDMYEQPAAPLSIGGVLDSGIKLFKASFNQVVWLAVAAGFISQLSGLMMGQGMGADGVPELGTMAALTLLVVMAASLVLFAAVVGRMDAVHRGAPISYGESLSLGVGCSLPLLGCFILYVLAIAIGSVLLIVPGLILMLSLMFAPYMIIIEGKGVIACLKDSHNLVWGNWWRTAAIISIAGFILMAAYMLFGIALVAVVAVEGTASATGGMTLTQAVLSALFNGLLTPFFYAMTLAVYYDLRVRRDGGDLAAKIEAAEAPA
jgi:hypothetical protein